MMKNNAKRIITLGSIAGALAAIGGLTWGAMSFAAPYIASKPPFESKDDAQKKFDEVAQNFQAYQRNSQIMLQQQLLLAQGFWASQLAQAQIMLRQNPNNLAAQQQATGAQQNLNAIQSQLYGGAAP